MKIVCGPKFSRASFLGPAWASAALRGAMSDAGARRPTLLPLAAGRGLAGSGGSPAPRPRGDLDGQRQSHTLDSETTDVSHKMHGPRGER